MTPTENIVYFNGELKPESQVGISIPSATGDTCMATPFSTLPEHLTARLSS